MQQLLSYSRSTSCQRYAFDKEIIQSWSNPKSQRALDSIHQRKHCDCKNTFLFLPYVREPATFPSKSSIALVCKETESLAYNVTSVD